MNIPLPYLMQYLGDFQYKTEFDNMFECGMWLIRYFLQLLAPIKSPTPSGPIYQMTCPRNISSSRKLGVGIFRVFLSRVFQYKTQFDNMFECGMWLIRYFLQLLDPMRSPTSGVNYNLEHPGPTPSSPRNIFYRRKLWVDIIFLNFKQSVSQNWGLRCL